MSERNRPRVKPFRMRIHDPSFVHLQSVGLLMPGNLVADTMAIMASLDPIMGGVDKEGGHVYGIDAAGGSIRDNYESVGSGSLFAYGVLEDNYKKGMSGEDAVDIAIRSLNAAMKRDSASGDGMAVSVSPCVPDASAP